MKHLINRLSCASTSYSLLRNDSLSSPRSRRVSKPRLRPSAFLRGRGVPVYVGIDPNHMERFVVSADLLNHPVFVSLLQMSAQIYGYDQQGALRIPCNVAVFERVLVTLRSGLDLARDDFHDLINQCLIPSLD